MSNYYLMQEQGKCIACFSCQMHCRANKNLPDNVNPCQIVSLSRKAVDGGKAQTANIFVACFHCENPWCVSACPTGAMQKREKDGIVIVQADKCVGCRACIDVFTVRSNVAV